MAMSSIGCLSKLVCHLSLGNQGIYRELNESGNVALNREKRNSLSFFLLWLFYVKNLLVATVPLASVIICFFYPVLF